jgi:hypothetical protein
LINQKKVFAIGLLATVLTVSLAFGVLPLISNHLSGSSLLRPSLVLTGNTTGTIYTGDTFLLVANITDGVSGVLVTFYDNGYPIGTGTTSGGITSITYVEVNMQWDIHAEATHP